VLRDANKELQRNSNKSAVVFTMSSMRESSRLARLWRRLAGRWVYGNAVFFARREKSRNPELSPAGNNSTLTLVKTFVLATGVCMAYEVAKHLLFPNITPWRSHSATVALVGVASTVAAYCVLRTRLSDFEEMRRAQVEKTGLSRAIEQAAEAIVITDVHANIQYVNPAFVAMTGYRAEEAIGQNTRLLKSGDQNSVYYKDLWQTIAAGEVWHGELMNRRKDGSHYLEEMTITPVRDTRGKITNYIAIKQDVTERRAAEEARRFLASIVDSSEDAIVGHTLEGTIVSWNRGAEAIFGYSAGEVVGKPVSTLVAPERTDNARQVAQALAYGRSARFEGVGLTKNGKRIDISLCACPIKDSQGQVAAASAIIRDITASKHAERARDLLASIVESSDDAIIGKTLDGMIVSWNKGAEALYGYRGDEVLGRPISILAPQDNADEVPLILDKIKGGELVSRFETVRVRKDGTRIYVSLTASPIENGRGEIVGASVIAHDITERERAKQLDRGRRDIVESIVQRLPIDQIMRKLISVVENQAAGLGMSVVLSENGRLYHLASNLPGTIVQATNGMEAQLNEENAGDRVASPWRRVISDRETDAFWIAFREASLQAGYQACWAAPILSASGDVLGVVALCRQDRNDPTANDQKLIDMTVQLAAVAIEQRRLHDRLFFQAHHDMLTGLPNRFLLDDRLTQCVARARRDGTSCAVLQIDLDRFKLINDCFGHAIGDALLKAVVERLGSCVRQTDTLSRVGGDEFTLILTDLHDVEDAHMVAEQLLATLQKPFDIPGTEIFVTCSIGIALYPQDATDAATLLKNGDAAMYRAKNSGKNQWHGSIPEAAPVGNRLELENCLHRALDRNELEVFYQPIYNTATGRLASMEALLRWRHPRLGLLPPSQFVGIAEETGLIVPIGNWVMKQACRDARGWQASSGAGCKVSVNVSAVQFARSDLVQLVSSVLAETGLQPSRLELEVTESAVMRNMELSCRQMADLRALGVSIAIDDFGTGYSALSYLQQLPVDYVKIDQSFVREMSSGTSPARLVQAIVRMAHALGLKVTAEGIETQAQLAALREFGCDQVQGFLLGRPMPVFETAPSSYLNYAADPIALVG
jgi:diguanylate cyclase (GGDEF)-like protein/PAS domain S-box-containing protein